jgi:hypothetical protein
MFMRSLRSLYGVTAATALLCGACLSDTQGGGGGGTGGSGDGGSRSGGASGGSITASGGAGSSGGASSSGETTVSGGTTGSGGTTESGGATGGGGVSASGGVTSQGGRTGSGGTTVRGGTTGSGGTAGQGGTTASGGSTARGGTTGTGGTTAAGGTVGTGGTTSTPTGEKFSFFVTSYAALQKIANSTKGLGGDLRYGETGAGAGLRGADKICAEIAESSMAGAGAKPWRAFLSATAGENGQQVNAVERIGSGPWYDRLGRLFANNLDELYYDRPQNADAAIKYDFPNENGVPNQNPDKTGNVDNHDTITGSNSQGKLYSATATCSDWTSATASTGQKPRVGHSWPTNKNECSTTSTLTATGSGGNTGTGRPGGAGMGSMCNWMSALDESGCAPGVNLIQTGGPGSDGTIGSGGGYGGWYCFALTP